MFISLGCVKKDAHVEHVTHVNIIQKGLETWKKNNNKKTRTASKQGYKIALRGQWSLWGYMLDVDWTLRVSVTCMYLLLKTWFCCFTQNNLPLSKARGSTKHHKPAFYYFSLNLHILTSCFSHQCTTSLLYQGTQWFHAFSLFGYFLFSFIYLFIFGGVKCLPGSDKAS